MPYKISTPKAKEQKSYEVETERSFLLDDDGTKADAYYFSLLNKGYKPLYFNAPYHWGVANPKTNVIISYTEGDIDKTITKNKEVFISELDKMQDFWKKSDKKIYGEIKYNRQEEKF